MTSLQLLLWIVGSILLQLAIYLSLAFWRHWTDYAALQRKANEQDIQVTASDLIEEPEPVATAWTGLRTFKVASKVVEDAARSVCSFTLVPQDGGTLPPFLPGQFLTFALDIPNANGVTEPVVRCYSLSDAPRPDHYRVTIKREPAPAGSTLAPGRSSNYFHDQVEPGCELKVRAPAGHFHLDHGDSPVVLIGGGVGITPMLSMLTWCLTNQAEREIWLFYGVRHESELVMAPQLEALAAAHPHFHLHFCLSVPSPKEVAARGHRLHGRVNVALLRRLLPLKPFHFYICGPTPMLQSLVPALEDWGVPQARIHFEAFGPASIARKTPATPPNGVGSSFVVTFAKSGQQWPWQAGMGSLLELAESHGISVASGCRAGGCGSCQTAILSGEVAYSQPPDCDPEPGSCLLCVCTPRTSVTLEA